MRYFIILLVSAVLAGVWKIFFSCLGFSEHLSLWITLAVVSATFLLSVPMLVKHGLKYFLEVMLCPYLIYGKPYRSCLRFCGVIVLLLVWIVAAVYVPSGMGKLIAYVLDVDLGSFEYSLGLIGLIVILVCSMMFMPMMKSFGRMFKFLWQDRAKLKKLADDED